MKKKTKDPAKEKSDEEEEKIQIEGDVEVEEGSTQDTEDADKGIVEVRAKDLSDWKPKTELGKKIKSGDITDIDQIIGRGTPILEAEIVDALVPNLTTELLLIGQSKGKFGGGQRRVFKQTQKKTREGNKPRFAAYAVVGDREGHVGIGYGKSKETVPAREKALGNAKKNIIRIKRGCGSWQCDCGTNHSLPFKVEGKCGSVKITLIPAPKGTGLRIQHECAKILETAGIKDVWSHTMGQTRTTVNLVNACFSALKSLSLAKVQPSEVQNE